MRPRHIEWHHSSRIGWLRAAVLGANDGILSTASLILGVSAAHASHHAVLITGIAGLVSGAMSMAAGEYVSVHSQADTEKADIALERNELKTNDIGEHEELEQIYSRRGLSPALVKQVVNQLMAHNALDAHLKNELGISKTYVARPIQAAIASAASFSIGAAMPILVTYISSSAYLSIFVSVTSIGFLALLGCISAKVGGVRILTSALRVTFWGTLAMLTTALVGTIFGVTT